MNKKLLIISAVITFLWAPELKAFMCTALQEGQGVAVFWSKRVVPFVLDSKGTEDIAGSGELDTLREAFAVWNSVSCSDFTFSESTEAFNGKIGFDYLEPLSNQNSLSFYEKNWPYSSLAIAITTVTANNYTGEILDADIEFNSENFVFTNSDLLVKTDLKNTAVHEIGHMLGLEHTATNDSVMYPYAATAETRCRTLFPDDEEAICFKYPTGEENGFCADSSDCKNNCRAFSPPKEKINIIVKNADSGCNQSGSATFWGFFPFLIYLLGRFVRQNYCS